MCLAIPGRIVEIDDPKHLATVEVLGVRREVNVQLLAQQGIAPDDWVLIHVGFAMSKISAEDAEEQMRLLEMLGGSEEARTELESYGTRRAPTD